MAAIDPFSTVRGGKAAAFFEPHARLIQVLYPRAKGVAVYDASGTLVWQKDADLDASLSGQVRALLQDSNDPEKNEQHGWHRLLQGSIPAYLFWLRDERGEPLGIVGVTGKAPGMNAPPPAFTDIEKVLQPVLQCLAREIATLRRIPSADQDRETLRLEQSEWVASRILPLLAPGQKEPLRAMLTAVVDRADAALAALVIPDRSLRLVVEPDGWNNEQAQDALRRAHRRLLTSVVGKCASTISNRVREKGDEASAYRLVAVPLLQRADQAAGYLLLLKSSIGSDFGPLEQRLLERIAPLAYALVDRDYDALTSLHTLAGFEQAARRVLPADGTPPASVICVDIEGLGEINARLDGDAADRVIRRVAKLLRTPQVPASTISARLAGGRFACLLPKCELEEAERVAERIREAARKLAAARDKRAMEVRLRTGVAVVLAGANGLRDALIAAHAAARDAHTADKILGGTEHTSQTRTRSGRQKIPVFLREALREERVRVFAQPMRALRDPRRPLRLELLARILDDQKRLVTPLEFLAAGPDPDALAELDRCVMTLTLAMLVEHSATVARQRIELALNVSGRSLEISEFHDWICEQLRRCVVPADSWLFEISETTASRQPRDVEKFARRIMSVGARVVLDDVGSAGSDAVRLKTHHASAIKMDGSLIRDLADDPRAQRLVEALTQWAANSRMETVAEQVESELVRDKLARFGIDYVQGYVICEPRPFVDILEELAQPDSTLRATA